MAAVDDYMQHGLMVAEAAGDINLNAPVYHIMKMHMTFFWGDKAEILFAGWPGGYSTSMYYVALVFVFLLSVLVEWLSRSFLKPGSDHVAARLARTLMHTIRVGLAYLVMLALMSFNGGVFIAVVLGHSIGFLIFGSRHIVRTETTPLPDMSC